MLVSSIVGSERDNVSKISVRRSIATILNAKADPYIANNTRNQNAVDFALARGQDELAVFLTDYKNYRYCKIIFGV